MELKEFLYVDVDRVRSLLSQMAGGVIEEVKSSTTSTMSGQAQAVLFGVGAKGDYKQATVHEEARSLQDLTFVAFEGLANENGFIQELPVEMMDAEAWRSGEVHRSLQAGQLVSVQCPVQFLDSSFFTSRIERFASMIEAFVDMNGPGPGQNPKKAQNPASAAARSASAARAEAIKKVLGDGEANIDQFQAIARLIHSFAGDSVLVRVLPCGVDEVEFGFTGTLLGRREYIQEERENLFSRYGQAPTTWRTVFQISEIPSEKRVEMPVGTKDVDGSGAFSRANVEQMSSALLAMLEQLGLVEGSKWPSISVTPLGIYRSIPRAN